MNRIEIFTKNKMKAFPESSPSSSSFTGMEIGTIEDDIVENSVNRIVNITEHKSLVTESYNSQIFNTKLLDEGKVRKIQKFPKIYFFETLIGLLLFPPLGCYSAYRSRKVCYTNSKIITIIIRL